MGGGCAHRSDRLGFGVGRQGFPFLNAECGESLAIGRGVEHRTQATRCHRREVDYVEGLRRIAIGCRGPDGGPSRTCPVFEMPGLRRGDTDTGAVLVEPGVYTVDIELPPTLAGFGDQPIVVTVTGGGGTFTSRLDDTAPRVSIL